MISFLKILRNNKIFKNFSYLGIIQFINLIFPIITYPYLIRTLGEENYGLVIYATSIVSFITIVINFGFNITATKSVSLNRTDKGKINRIVSSIFIIKLLLFITCYFIYTLVILFSNLHNNFNFFIIFGLLALNDIIMPVWYFQGVEKLKFISIVTFFNKLIFVLLMLLLIRTKNDFFLVPQLQLVGIFVSLFIIVYILFSKEKVKLCLPPFTEIWGHFKISFPFFTSRVSSVITMEANSILIGSLIGLKEVAYYDLAKKVANIFLMPYNVLNQAVYPNVVASKDMKLMKRIIKYVAYSSVILYGFLLLFSKKVIILFAGELINQAIPLLFLLGFLIVVLSISYFLGNTVLVVMDKNYEFNFSVILQMIVFTALTIFLILIDHWTAQIAALLVVLSVSVQTSYRFYIIRKFRLL